MLPPLDDITVVIPTIATRYDYLIRAVKSVLKQTRPPGRIIICNDTNRDGAAVTRQAGLEQSSTTWTAFLDDDDEFLPYHLEKLYECARDQGADYVYSWYEVVGGTDPRPEEFGAPWDPANPRQTTITTLVRTELAQKVGGFTAEEDTREALASPDRHYAGEDYRFTKRMNDAGAKIVHLPQVTWYWHHHGANTSGLAARW